MGDSFGSADTVVLDLGAELGASTEEYEALRTACFQLNELPDSEWPSDIQRQNLYSVPQGIRDICTDSRIWSAFADLVCRPYWTRVWMIQENNLARRREIIVGNAIWSEEVFDKPFFRLFEVVRPIYTAMITLKSEIVAGRETGFESPVSFIFKSGRNCRDIQGLRAALLGTESKKIDFLRMIERVWTYLATDPRDRVYTLLSLSHFAGIPYELSVDYSISVEELSLNVSKLYIASRKFGRLLRLIPATVNGTLPSWCLDLRLENTGKLAVQYSESEETCFSASGSMDEYLEGPSSVQPEIIAVGGFLWDSVPEVIVKMRDPEPDGENVDAAEKQARWDNTITQWTEKFFGEQLSREEIVEARWKTMIMDLDSANFVNSTRATPQSGQIYRDYEHLIHLVGQGRADIDDVDETVLENGLKFFNTLKETQNMKRMGGTSIHRQIGLFPDSTVAGDKICIISGVPVPWVIRPQPTTVKFSPTGVDLPYFKLEGPCYIHGIMDGEALRHPDFQSSSILIG